MCSCPVNESEIESTVLPTSSDTPLAAAATSFAISAPSAAPDSAADAITAPATSAPNTAVPFIASPITFPLSSSTWLSELSSTILKISSVEISSSVFSSLFKAFESSISSTVSVSNPFIVASSKSISSDLSGLESTSIELTAWYASISKFSNSVNLSRNSALFLRYDNNCFLSSSLTLLSAIAIIKYSAFSASFSLTPEEVLPE